MKITQVRRDLESNETLTCDLETYRVRRQLAARLTNARGDRSMEAARVQVRRD